MRKSAAAHHDPFRSGGASHRVSSGKLRPEDRVGHVQSAGLGDLGAPVPEPSNREHALGPSSDADDQGGNAIAGEVAAAGIMKVLLVHNPASGDAARVSSAEIVTLIRDAGHEVAHKSSTESWDRWLDQSWDLVAVAGGDGTVGKVAASLMGRRVPLAILPLEPPTTSRTPLD